MELQTAIEILEYHQEWRLGKREDMIHEPKKLTEALDIVLSEVKKFCLGTVSISVLEQIRQAFADYRRAEGCSCCRDNDAHKEAEKRLAELLRPIPYDDGSGFDWWQYCTER